MCTVLIADKEAGFNQWMLIEQENSYMHLNITQDFVLAKYTNGSEKGIKHNDLEQT